MKSTTWEQMTCCNLEASVGDLVVVLQATVLLLYAHFPKIKICLDVFHPEFQIAGGRLNGCCGIYSSAKESMNETKLLPQILTMFYFLLLAQELATLGSLGLVWWAGHCPRARAKYERENILH